jgi:hypothetical protein
LRLCVQFAATASRLLLSCFCLALAAVARGQGTFGTVLKGNGQKGSCFVGVYGWTCDTGGGASDFDSANAAYETILALAAASSAGGGGAAPAVVASPACSVLCAANCTPPCDTNCSKALFEAELVGYAAGTLHYYIDPWLGSDGASGNSADAAWATVRRGQAQLRWARASGQAAFIQLWFRGGAPLTAGWSWRPLQLT